MEYRFADLVDLDAFRALLRSFYDATGILHGLLDADDEVISAAGWQEACTAFHRVHPCTARRCRESNRYLAEHMGSAPFIGHQCGNGLMDYAAAIVVEGRQLATLYFGQVFHAPPDLERFRALARECGFDEEAYLAAIRRVPVVPRERAVAIMAFYAELAQTLARAGLHRLRQRDAERRLAEANRDLAARVDARTRELAAKNAELQTLMDSSPVALGWSNAAGELEYVNRRFTELSGWALEEVPTVDRWLEAAYPDPVYRAEVARALTRPAAPGAAGPALVETAITCKDGTVRHALTGTSRAGERRLGIFLDVTDRWVAEQREQLRSMALELIARNAPLRRTLTVVLRGVQSEDPDLLCAVVFPGRHGPPQRVGAPEAPGADPASCESEVLLALDGRPLGTFTVRHRQGRALGERDRRTVRAAARLARIAIERHLEREELERQAHTDFLTGVANRRHLIELARRELERAARFHRPLSLLMLDIDHFKAVNDVHGHDAGDAVLRVVAGTLQDTLRTIDVVGRLGGEEFAVVLPETDGRGAREAAERLRRAVAHAEAPIPGGALRVTVSVGVATRCEAAASLDALLSRADRALYAAKKGGRNRVCVAPPIEAIAATGTDPPGAS